MFRSLHTYLDFGKEFCSCLTHFNAALVDVLNGKIKCLLDKDIPCELFLKKRTIILVKPKMFSPTHLKQKLLPIINRGYINVELKFGI